MVKEIEGWPGNILPFVIPYIVHTYEQLPLGSRSLMPARRHSIRMCSGRTWFHRQPRAYRMWMLSEGLSRVVLTRRI